ncbi:hypothetical protein LJR230_000692 [Trinickia sp. LjRoot230]|uniref:hypothetical protein n=1 Tax=Trinickia sp. LjRoot230 TaxID=3342288 RepID=UPI003ECEE768
MALSTRALDRIASCSWIGDEPMSAEEVISRPPLGPVFRELSPLMPDTGPFEQHKMTRQFSYSSKKGDRASETVGPIVDLRFIRLPGIFYRRITVKDFDFTSAPEYRREPIPMKRVTFAIKEHRVETVVNGKKETGNVAKYQAAIVTGPLGERYVPGNFANSFEQDPDNPWQYRPKPETNIRAIEMTEPVEFMPPWKQLQRIERGQFARTVVDLPDGTPDARLIEESAFNLTWVLKALVNDDGETPPVAPA